LVVLHRVVCCYPDYERLLAAAADHGRALVFSYPPRNALSRAFYSVFNLVMRLTGSSFRGFAHPPDAMLAVLEDHGLRRMYQRRSRIWQVAGLERGLERARSPVGRMAGEIGSLQPDSGQASWAWPPRPASLSRAARSDGRSTTSALCRWASGEGRGRAALSPRTHIAVSSIGVRR
jgi:hypothetical protein